MQIAFTAYPLPGKSFDGQPSFLFDPDFYRPRLGEIHEAGFASLVVDEARGILSNLDVAADVGRHLSGLGIIATHWPGTVSPVVAARQLAYLDTLLDGRLALRIVMDGASAGDTHHEAACRRTDEYLMLLKRLWSNERAFDYEGEFYSVRGGFVPAKGPQGHSIGLRMSGRTGTALRIAARHASVYELHHDTPARVAEQIGRIITAARAFGRSDGIGFALHLPVEKLMTTVRNGPKSSTVEIVASLVPFVDLGVSEFVVSGFDSSDVLRTIGTDVAALLKDTVDKQESGAFRIANARSIGSVGTPVN